MVIGPMGAMVGGASDQRGRALPADLVVDSFEVDVDRPLQGEVVTFSVHFRNVGEAQAQNVQVLLYRIDGAPPQEFDPMTDLGPVYLVDEKDVPVVNAGVTPAPATFSWNTTQARGFHTFWTIVTESVVTETDRTNNNGSVAITVADATKDLLVDSGVKVISGPKAYSQFLTFYGNAAGSITAGSGPLDATITYLSGPQSFFGIEVDDSASLLIDGVAINGIDTSGEDPANALPDFFLTAHGSSSVVLRDVTFENVLLSVGEGATLSGTNVVLHNSTIAISDAAAVSLDGLELSGRMSASGASAIHIDHADLTLRSTDPVIFTDVAFLDGDDWWIEQPSGFPGLTAALQVAGSTSAVVGDLVVHSPTVKQPVGAAASGDATLTIQRTLWVRTIDATGLVIPKASIDVHHESLSGPLADAKVADSQGMAQFLLDADQLSAHGATFIGNYELRAQITQGSTTHVTACSVALAHFPDLTEEGASQSLDCAFAPLPPTIPAIIKGELVVSKRPDAKDTIGGITIFGDLIIDTGGEWLLENTTLHIRQNRDYEFRVILKGTGTLTLKGAGIDSNHALNVYVLDDAVLAGSPSSTIGTIAANAIVGVGGRVDLSGTNIEADIRGEFKTFNMVDHTRSTTVNGTIGVRISEEMNLDGATITAEDRTTNWLEGITTSASVGFSHGLAFIPNLQATSQGIVKMINVSAYGQDVVGWTEGSSSLLLSGPSCQLTDGEWRFNASTIDCKSLAATKVDFGTALVFDDATGTLTSVIATSITVTGSTGLVEIFHELCVYATNALFGGLQGAQITVTELSGDTNRELDTQKTDEQGRACFNIKVASISQDGTTSTGFVNVALSYTDPNTNENVGRSQQVGMGEDQTIYFDLDINPTFEDLDLRATLTNGTQVFPPYLSAQVCGAVTQVYEGSVRLPSRARIEVEMLGQNVGETTVDAKGNYCISFATPDGQAIQREYAVNVTATDPTVPNLNRQRDNATLHLTVMPPHNKEIKFSTTVDPNPTNGDYIFTTGDLIIIAGVATYDTGLPYAGGTLTITLTGTSSSKVVNTDGQGRFQAELTVGVITDEVVKRHQISLTCTDTNAYGERVLCQATAKTPVDLAPVKKHTGGSDPTLMYIIIIVAAVAGAVIVGLFLYTLRRQALATLVECGECGAMIPENVNSCPKCNAEFDLDYVKCSECGAWNTADQVVCTSCGVDFKGGAAAGAISPAPGTPPGPSGPAGPPMAGPPPGMPPQGPPQG